MNNFQPIAQDGWTLHHFYESDDDVFHVTYPVAGWLGGQPAVFTAGLLVTPHDLRRVEPTDAVELTGPGDAPLSVVRYEGRLRVLGGQERRVQADPAGIFHARATH